MSKAYQFALDNSARLSAQVSQNDASEVSVKLSHTYPKDLILHWGMCPMRKEEWILPPVSVRPEGSQVQGDAVRTPFQKVEGQNSLELHLGNEEDAPCGIQFVLNQPESNLWIKNGRDNFFVPVSEAKRSPLEKTREERKARATHAFATVTNTGGIGAVDIAVALVDNVFQIEISAESAFPLVLHWGVSTKPNKEWSAPPESIHPPNTTVKSVQAVQTPFSAPNKGVSTLCLTVDEEDAPRTLQFVITTPAQDKWFKNNGGDFVVPLKTPPPPKGMPAGPVGSMLQDIISSEMEKSSWTLMHRFEMCNGLIRQVEPADTDSIAWFFVWLRYSALRQLDWQRRFNTKPRELAHSMDQLTKTLSDMFGKAPRDVKHVSSKEILRLALTTVGKGGGDGQRIRDEILHIMHRHHIKETKDHFYEEWHQKLHNNTTPDDIVICEAVLAFLQSNGDLNKYHETLKAGGVTKERLASFERSITYDPWFSYDLKDGLIRDFTDFLKILNSVHSATDLETVINGARWTADGNLQNVLNDILGNKHHWDKMAQMYRVTEARRQIRGRIDSLRDSGLRDMLFLDLGLEDYFRGLIEQTMHIAMDMSLQFKKILLVLENVLFSYDNEEITSCICDLKKVFDANRRLSEGDEASRLYALQIRAVIDRIHRTLGNMVDDFQRIFQQKGQFLGQSFNADEYYVNLFTEELIRGSPMFSLSALVKKVDPELRKIASIGPWQIISPASSTVSGTVTVIHALHEVQNKTYPTATVLITDKVGGEEEIPDGVVACIVSTASEAPDVLSHVAVRARNSHVLFVAVHDDSIVDELRSFVGRSLSLKMNASGDVKFHETTAADTNGQSTEREVPPEMHLRPPPKFTTYCIPSSAFTVDVAGGKSNNLSGLRGMIPDWIKLPLSACLPFGVCETVLSLKENKSVKTEINSLMSQVDRDPENLLTSLRQTMFKLQLPADLKSSVLSVVADSGMNFDANDWELACESIKGVWASKYNHRAYLSMKKANIDMNRLVMAVLIQQVIEADYAYVIHTKNPFTNDEGELYAEVVIGLGETLVGSYPGRAFSFTFSKAQGNREGRVLSFPNKSVALRGSGFIFRSDSNGEDLEGYAGAGLFDSIIMRPAKDHMVQYGDDPLYQDDRFRRELMRKIADIGIVIEQTLGSAQDIEGVISRGEYYVVQTRPQV